MLKTTLLTILGLFFSIGARGQAQSDPSTRPTKLVIWTSDPNAKIAIDAVGRPFCAKFKCQIETQVLNQNLTQAFRTAALAQKGPDLLFWAHDVSGELAESGLISPLNLPPKLKGQILPIALEAFSYKDRLYGYPITLAALALIRNTDLAPQAPQSLDDLFASAQKIQSSHKNVFGLLFEIKSFYFSYPFFSAQGGYIFAKKNHQWDLHDFGLTGAGAARALQKLAEAVQSKLIPSTTTRGIAFEKMLNRQLAFTIDGPWALKDLKKSGLPFAVTPLPKWSGQSLKPLVGAHGLMLRRSSPNQDLAKEFVEKALLTETGLMTFLENDPRVPALNFSSWRAKFSELDAFLYSVTAGVAMPNTPAMSLIWPAMGAALHQAIEGEKSAQTALELAAEKVRQQITPMTQQQLSPGQNSVSTKPTDMGAM